MRGLALLVALLTLAACTPEGGAIIRVTEFDGNGNVGPVSGAAVGCQVTQSEEVMGCFIYQGESCSFKSKDC